MRRALVVSFLVLFSTVGAFAGELQAITDMRQGIREKWASSGEWVAALSGDAEAARFAPFAMRTILAYFEDGSICELEGGSGRNGIRFVVLLRGEKKMFFPDMPSAWYEPERRAIFVSGIPDERRIETSIEMLMFARKTELPIMDDRLWDPKKGREWQADFALRIYGQIYKKPEMALGMR